uniref:ANF_receptor domain-containing protein n=1 Tax=Macrostomum lignano TaxID=282301 RepID=A0A1I8JPZ5_9PLAT
ESDGGHSQKHGWNYVTAIYDEGTYGERGFQEFKSHASQQEGICINKYLVIPRNARNDSLAGIADGLLKLEKSHAWLWPSASRDPAAPVWPAGEPLDQAELLLGGQRRLGTKDRTLCWGSSSWQRGPSACCREARAVAGAEQIGMHSRYEQEGLVPMVVDAVYAMAHSLENMLHRLCPSVHTQIVPRHHPEAERDGTARDHIRNVSFIGTSGNILRFNRKGDRESLYEIFQFQRRPAGKNASSVFEYVKIGTWGDDHLELDNSSLRWGTPDEVATQISLLGGPAAWLQDSGANKEAATCCWECVPCDNKISDSAQCDPPLPCGTIQLGSVWLSLPMTFSFLGLVWTVFVLVVFCPVQQHSDYQGVRPRAFCYKPSYTSPKSQLILCCCLVSVQVIGDMTWLGMDLPKT